MEYAAGNIFIRENELRSKGDRLAGHAHNFDHLTLVVRGSVRIERDLLDGRSDSVEQAAGDRGVVIEAGCRHRITALSDGTLFFCIYSHRLPQGDIVQCYTGWPDAYG